ncbi:MAG TPA: TRAP transporter large permease subunit [Burkholderiales bacterium]|nr:TRAP transporter large permease subunit [Burkholderiales bacterium]
MTATIIFVLLFGLMLTGMPVSISLGLTVLAFLFFMTSVPVESVALKLFTGIERFEIMAIPFFILAGNFLTHGGVARRMINFATSVVGHWHGGLGLAGVMACALFAAVSGSSPATVVAIGSIILPAMVKAGFPKRFGAGVITTSGALGILIPPSIVMVMYSVATNTSVGTLFMAGVVPGLVLAFMLGALTWYRARKNKYPRMQLVAGRTGGQASIATIAGLSASLFFIAAPIAALWWLMGRLAPEGTGILVVILGIAWLLVARLLTQNRFVLRWVFSVAFLATPPVVVHALLALFLPTGGGTLLLALFVIWILAAIPLAKKGDLVEGMAISARHEALLVWRSFWESVWGLLLVIVVLGGIYSGVFTPTEAAAMSAVYAFFVAVFVYKDMGLKQVPKVLLDSANMSAMLLYIITNAVLFSYLLTSEQIPQAMADWMIGQGLGAIGFLLMVNLLLLLAGNVMEPSSIVLITAPILFPVATKLGIDPVHFGILITVNMEVGMCHPPVGLNLYVASGITKMGITELTIAVWPWLLTMLVFLVIVTYWPPLSLWLPRLLGMMT